MELGMEIGYKTVTNKHRTRNTRVLVQCLTLFCKAVSVILKVQIGTNGLLQTSGVPAILLMLFLTITNLALHLLLFCSYTLMKESTLQISCVYLAPMVAQEMQKIPWQSNNKVHIAGAEKIWMQKTFALILLD